MSYLKVNSKKNDFALQQISDLLKFYLLKQRFYNFIIIYKKQTSKSIKAGQILRWIIATQSILKFKRMMKINTSYLKMLPTSADSLESLLVYNQTILIGENISQLHSIWLDQSLKLQYNIYITSINIQAQMLKQYQNSIYNLALPYKCQMLQQS
ncbi:hypothetical protein TTHERM_001412070 (macronuclear) [Tetrahymena thermophila SB210]|uniref:Uncharacterized protein n=1 Tax=Tetrahymena thermophila (strain SB210) TaxID=312017 RepID=W7XG85_TETTS|nr:hypothetical protein TTHERM_001412070 [Tetrahymena thermophila SB210]EWS75933.1 hypothetical protein TTHERM_001412070 [Tetrahymena thermophila SB210]|eukprot:XP_012651534.1 hypothetical protein TTHERM_001412070 [Tetrahymena thermophila SB210]